LLFALAERAGSTLILITHDPALADRCARVIEIADGAIVADRSRDERARRVADAR
jgi:putative ABC transport system ATP-binding protein